MNWPVPRSASQVRAFLSLVRYVVSFLPKLVEHTAALTPLTTKEAELSFPTWSPCHQTAFDAIKSLVCESECLTVIDHDKLDNNRIFVTCDASDLRTGAMLSFGPNLETAHPVVFNSVQLKGAELNYPVHEEELLAIVRALKKWQYIPGEQNAAADVLSRSDLDAVPPKLCDTVCAIRCLTQSLPLVPHDTVATVSLGSLRISSDPEWLHRIRSGYASDSWCSKLLGTPHMPGVRVLDGLLYVSDCLVIPRVPKPHEGIFRCAHDVLGHFGPNKSYATLRGSYYWPNMRKELNELYIPSCDACQRNKSSRSRPSGPLHPLPIPEHRGDAIAIDFISPLPSDFGYICLATVTDCPGADIRLIPTTTNVSAEDFAIQFFNSWYCKNGLPLEIISDRDKLFVSAFWKALHRLSGVKLKMSSSYHPQTDGASERTNKTVIQALHFHVSQNQCGRVRALPYVRFAIMNTVNTSTGFSPFQLHIGRNPRMLPPISHALHDDVANEPAGDITDHLISRIDTDVLEARDNLFLTKVVQAQAANRSRGPENPFSVGNRVLLSTFHRHRDYMQRGDHRAAKFMVRYDGPYTILQAHPEALVYTLDLPPSMNIFPTFHLSLLRPYRPNDDALFPSHAHAHPGPVVTDHGVEEYEVESIIDRCRRG
ncbi:hypothetical protein NUW54_g5196 [Trametes sanguinea]|nr:hypothetical protein NUW54_g5196 [Trametes sanguinea]